MEMVTSVEFAETFYNPDGLTGQVIPVLKDIMAYEDSLGLPSEQTFYSGVLSWLMFRSVANFGVYKISSIFIADVSI